MANIGGGGGLLLTRDQPIARVDAQTAGKVGSGFGAGGIELWLSQTHRAAQVVTS